mmetsp:Transcript_8957/g.10455  ORF Transcript_8957/g.10455 Transcript_8957/m.10455 type:complete len:118 (-) Transcript_8957:17-370(-)
MHATSKETIVVARGKKLLIFLPSLESLFPDWSGAAPAFSPSPDGGDDTLGAGDTEGAPSFGDFEEDDFELFEDFDDPDPDADSDSDLRRLFRFAGDAETEVQVTRRRRITVRFMMYY